MENKLLSIIIVVYNDASNLVKSLLALHNQTFTNFEVIIIDGASSDDTLLVAHNFKEQYLTTTYNIYSEKDSGIYNAMNKGIKLAKGQWLYFYNAGDTFFDNTTLSTVSSHLINTNADIVYGNVQRTDGIFINSISSVNFFSLNYSLGICHQSIFCKRASMILFNENYKLVADYHWLLCQCKLKKFFKKINKTIIIYDASGKSSNTNVLRKEFLKVLKETNKINYLIRKVIWVFK